MCYMYGDIDAEGSELFLNRLCKPPPFDHKHAYISERSEVPTGDANETAMASLRF